ncbi:MAG: hypothetical protein B6D79_08585 [gamma proteobacterium symbiont of Ctena orbiculata]|nr:MAG: hypothetical protein B6D79_08585 [gamma proteobacterium symbiont of Ctena orbiculata]
MSEQASDLLILLCGSTEYEYRQFSQSNLLDYLIMANAMRAVGNTVYELDAENRIYRIAGEWDDFLGDNTSNDQP